ncbi:MAG: hypothetical protein ACREFS_06240 [Acetobacteraceae bacterium]
MTAAAQADRGRNVIERAFCHLKDWRRIATRYDKLARNFAASVILAAIFRSWISLSLEPSGRLCVGDSADS